MLAQHQSHNGSTCPICSPSTMYSFVAGRHRLVLLYFFNRKHRLQYERISEMTNGIENEENMNCNGK